MKISKDAWVWVTAATLASSPDTDLLASFYIHLTTKYSEFQIEEQKSRISVCFRDILLKLITLVGAPRILCVLSLLAKAKGDVEAKSSANPHKEDVRVNEILTIHGFYLSDYEVLSSLETEAVVYATVSCLGLGGPGNWHLRGMGR